MTVNNYKISKWAEYKNKIEMVNPYFADSIKLLGNMDNFEVVEFTYEYGQNIISAGNFKVFDNNKFSSWGSSNINKELCTLFDYNWQVIPFGMVIENSAESHINHTTHTASMMLQESGKTFSNLTIFETKSRSMIIPSLYSTTAGCRSLIMLPKISQAHANEYLAKKYGQFSNGTYVLENLCPKNLAAQWDLFKEIALSPSFREQHGTWETKLLLFTAPFVEKIMANSECKFNLLQGIWERTSFVRNLYMYNFIWSLFIQRLSLKEKHNSLVIETVKHIIKIILGDSPGYIPATNNISAPIAGLQNAFLNVYKLRHHLPNFMRLQHYSGKDPVYYSIQKPNFFHEIPTLSGSKKSVIEISSIMDVFNQFKNAVLNEQLNHSLKGSSLYTALEQTNVTFIHPLGKGANLTKNISDIFKSDSRFSQFAYGGTMRPDLVHAEKSIFFNGLVKICPY